MLQALRSVVEYAYSGTLEITQVGVGVGVVLTYISPPAR